MGLHIKCYSLSFWIAYNLAKKTDKEQVNKKKKNPEFGLWDSDKTKKENGELCILGRVEH